MAYILDEDGAWTWEKSENPEENIIVRQPVETIPSEPPDERIKGHNWKTPRSEADWKEWEYRQKINNAADAVYRREAEEAKWQADIKSGAIGNKNKLPVIGDTIPEMPPEKAIGGGTTYRPAAATRKDGVRRFSNIASDAGDPTVGYINDKKPSFSLGGDSGERSKFEEHLINSQFGGKHPKLRNAYSEASEKYDPTLQPEEHKKYLEAVSKQIKQQEDIYDFAMNEADKRIKIKDEELKKVSEKEEAKGKAFKEITENDIAIISIQDRLNQTKDSLGNTIVRSPDEIKSLNGIIQNFKNRNKSIYERFPDLAKQPEAATKTDTLTPEQKETAKQLFARKRAEGKDMATAMKEMKAEMGTAQAKPQIPAVSKPTVKPQIKPEIAPVIPAEPPGQAIKSNPNKARIISRPAPKTGTVGEAYQKRLLGPTPVEYEAADQELIDLASKLGVGPQNWKSLGSYAKAAGEGAWLMYTDAIGRALAGQKKARMELTGAK